MGLVMLRQTHNSNQHYSFHLVALGLCLHRIYHQNRACSLVLALSSSCCCKYQLGTVSSQLLYHLDNRTPLDSHS